MKPFMVSIFSQKSFFFLFTSLTSDRPCGHQAVPTDLQKTPTTTWKQECLQFSSFTGSGRVCHFCAGFSSSNYETILL